MNRRLWTAVAMIIGLLGGVSFVFGPVRLTKLSTTIGHYATLATAAFGALPWSVVTVLALAAAAATVALLWRERRRRAGHGEPWRTVVSLGKQGRPISVIARDTGLTQDAVRIVLAPVAFDPSFPRGNSFRSSSPLRSDSQPRDQSRRRP
jgi:membrane protein implicated in regulation of membrane protease activity